MTKLSPKAEMLAQSFSDMFWDLVAWYDEELDDCKLLAGNIADSIRELLGGGETEYEGTE